MKKLLVLLALALLLSNSSLISTGAEKTPVSDGVGPIPPSSHNSLVILAAYDEEMAVSLHHWNDRDVDAETYVGYQLSRAFHWYPIQFRIAKYKQWDSDDRLLLNETLLEVVRELNWNPGGSIQDGVFCDFLVAFTGQDNDSWGGVASCGLGVAVIKHQDWVPDDNAVMHELGHLFGLHHCGEHCVMSNGGQFWFLYDEPLSPIEEGYVTLVFFRWEYYCYLAYEFCSAHWEALKDHTRIALNGTEIEIDPEWNEAPKGQLIAVNLLGMDLDPEWNSSPHIIIIVAVLGSSLTIIAIIVIIGKRWKRYPNQTKPSPA